MAQREARQVDGKPGPDLLGYVLQVLGIGLGPANVVAAMLGLPDLKTWLESHGVDEKNLTNLLFFVRHPEMQGRKIQDDETHLATEWLEIRDDIVRPFLRRMPGTGGPGTGGGAQDGPPTAGGGGGGTTDPAAPGTTKSPTTTSEDDPDDPAPPGSAPGTAAPAGEMEFVKDAMRTTIELLPEKQRARFEGIEWGWLDYPGNNSKAIKAMDAEELARYRRDTSLVEGTGKKTKGHFIGKHQDDAKALFKALAKVRPGGGERRANWGKTAVLTKDQFRKDPKAYDDYIEEQLEYLVDHPRHKNKMMNKHAAEKFAELRAAAAADGVDIRVRNAYRLRKTAEANAKKAGNSNAVAAFSAHSLGLAMDLNLWTASMAKTGERWTETSTTNFPSLMRMLGAPAYKWMYLYGAKYGFFQFRPEPWHWEYNPPGFREKFFAEDPSLMP